MFEKFSDPNAYYTSSDIMNNWGISYSTLYRSVLMYNIKFVRLGKQKAYKGSDLNKIIDDKMLN